MSQTHGDPQRPSDERYPWVADCQTSTHLS